MICAIVASAPPSPFDGRANSIGLPLRSRPRASKRLFRYVDAVFRFSESIALGDQFGRGIGWGGSRVAAGGVYIHLFTESGHT